MSFVAEVEQTEARNAPRFERQIAFTKAPAAWSSLAFSRRSVIVSVL
jgi:hypothetical protein